MHLYYKHEAYPPAPLNWSVQAWQHVTLTFITRAKGRRTLRVAPPTQFKLGLMLLSDSIVVFIELQVSCSHPTHFHIAVWNHSLVTADSAPSLLCFCHRRPPLTPLPGIEPYWEEPDRSSYRPPSTSPQWVLAPASLSAAGASMRLSAVAAWCQLVVQS